MKSIKSNGVLSTALSVICVFCLNSESIAQEVDPVLVSTVAVQNQTISEFEFAQGTVQSANRAYLTFESSGRVAFIKSSDAGTPLREGEVVKSGELLASLDEDRSSVSMEASEAKLATANSVLEAATSDYDRTKSLNASGNISKRDFENSKAAYEQALANVRAAEAEVNLSKISVSETQLRAPFDGVVAFINITEGQYFNLQQFDPTNDSKAAGTAPIMVIDPSSFEIVIDVPQYVGRRLEIGQNAFLLSQEALAILQERGNQEDISLREFLVPAKLVSVSPAVNPEDRSIRARIETDEVQKHLKDGDYVTVWLELGRKENVAIIPFEALIERSGRRYAFVVDKDSKVARREVTLGLIGIDGVEVLDGLEVGDIVVTKGKSRLNDGDPVSVSNAP